MVSSLLEFVLTCFACSETEGKNGEGGAEKGREVHGEENKFERARFQGRSVLEKYFSFFTRCSRSAFPYVFGVLTGMGHGVLLVR